MSKQYYVYSTLANDQAYTVYNKGAGDLPVKSGEVVVKGGTGVADKRLFTPRGVATSISEGELELLKKNPVFVQHQANGHVVVENKKEDAEKVATNMSGRDESSPLTESDYKAGEEPKLNNKNKR